MTFRNVNVRTVIFISQHDFEGRAGVNHPRSQGVYKLHPGLTDPLLKGSWSSASSQPPASGAVM